MQEHTEKLDGQETAAVMAGEGFIPVQVLNEKTGKSFSTDLFEIIRSGQLEEINSWYRREGKDRLSSLADRAISIKAVRFGPLYRCPRKIWGIGLNYAEHAADLAEKAPNTEPASFMKPDTTIIGPEDYIKIPVQSERTTAESELGIIIGRRCKDVSDDHAAGRHYFHGYAGGRSNQRRGLI